MFCILYGQPPSTTNIIENDIVANNEGLSDTITTMEQHAGDLLLTFQCGHHRCSKVLFRRTRRFILHDVWFPRRLYDFDTMCHDITATVLDFVRPDGFWYCFKHTNDSPHIHFVHDCAYSNKSCRCGPINAIQQRYKARRKHYYNRRVIRRGNFRHLSKYIHYLHYTILEGRQRLATSVDGHTWVEPSTVAYNAISTSQDTRSNTTLPMYEEVCTGSVESHTSHASNPGTTSAISRVREHNQRRVWSRKQYAIEAIFRWLQEHIIIPDHDITSSAIWLDGEFKFITERDPIFQNALKIHRTILSTKSLIQLIEFLNSVEYIQYYPQPHNLLSVTDSATFIYTILFLQMSVQETKEFLSFLFLLLKHESQKCNCLLISGPPSVGKTWFANIVGKLMINTGYIGNSNRFSQVPFQDCPRRNLLIFDEPNVEPMALENFKLLFAGTPTPANIKYESQNLINRTPVIVTCNRDPFPKTPEFQTRIRRFYWTHRIDNNIKALTSEIHPLGLFQLLTNSSSAYTAPNDDDIIDYDDFGSDYSYMHANLEEDNTKTATDVINNFDLDLL